MALRYSPKIVTNGLALYLDAGNTISYPGSGTTWTDLSRENNNGTLTNGPTFSDGSIVFDGVDDYVTGTGLSSSLSVFTLDATIFTNINDLANYAGLFHTTGIDGIRLKGNFVTTPRIYTAATGGANFSTTTANLTSYINQWLFITFVFKGSEVDLYYNSEYKDSITLAPSFDFSTYEIGRNSYDPAFFEGKLPLLKIYNRALSSDEVLQNYNATKGRFGL